MISDSGETYLPGYDRNGNVVALVKSSSGVPAASCEYSPFRETLVETKEDAVMDRFKFSSKYEDLETAFLYHGYRYFAPTLGRWLARDPLGDTAFFQEYVRNMREAESLVLIRSITSTALPHCGKQPC
ncbi:MAG: RHS repeat-associated core domain-containing protein [Acidobacteriota bacterium]